VAVLARHASALVCVLSEQQLLRLQPSKLLVLLERSQECLLQRCCERQAQSGLLCCNMMGCIDKAKCWLRLRHRVVHFNDTQQPQLQQDQQLHGLDGDTVQRCRYVSCTL
jgi:hypothetical protein